MNDLIYQPLQEAETLNVSMVENEKCVYPAQHFFLMLFLVSCISLAGWSTYQHVSASADYSTPWRLVINQNNKGATIQFSHSSSGRFSPLFQVQQDFAEDYDVKFYNLRCEIPGVEVNDFSAVNLPGAISLSVGKDKFLISKRGIIFNQESFGWGNYSDKIVIDQFQELQSNFES